MLKNLKTIEGSKELTKNSQKNITGGLTAYVSSCHPVYEGAPCLTGFPHCPTGFCAGYVCSPTAT